MIIYHYSSTYTVLTSFVSKNYFVLAYLSQIQIRVQVLKTFATGARLKQPLYVCIGQRFGWEIHFPLLSVLILIFLFYPVSKIVFVIAYFSRRRRGRSILISILSNFGLKNIDKRRRQTQKTRRIDTE